MRQRKLHLIATLPKSTPDQHLGITPAAEVNWDIERKVKRALRDIPERMYHQPELDQIKYTRIPGRRSC